LGTRLKVEDYYDDAGKPAKHVIPWQ